MARDRQRAKQRRTRPPGPPGGASGRGRSGRRARDLSGTPTPDPLDHASAEVDEALLAEAGAQPPQVRADEDDEHLAEEEPARGPRAPDAEPGGAVAASRAEGAPGRGRSGVGGFLRGSADELRRVQWPDRRQVGQGTAVTLGFVVIAGGYLGLLDAIWKPLIDAIL
jgi:preprotein translocase SecE subunit